MDPTVDSDLETDAAKAPATHPSQRQRSWLARLNPFQEQQFARRVTREMVNLRRQVLLERPEARGVELLRLVVMRRCMADAQAAQRLLDEADESFATWPTTRDIDFADVVHLIAVREFHAAYGKTRWINSNMGRIIAAELQRLR